MKRKQGQTLLEFDSKVTRLKKESYDINLLKAMDYSCLKSHIGTKFSAVINCFLSKRTDKCGWIKNLGQRTDNQQHGNRAIRDIVSLKVSQCFAHE